MTFKRIDEVTINCIITTDDLEERGLSAEDLFKKREEAAVFLKEVIDQAGREVDYHPSGAYITMQIAILPDQSISLTLSESQEASLAGMLRGLAERLQKFIEQLNAVEKNGPDGPVSAEPQTKASARKEAIRREAAFVFAFDSVHTAARFASAVRMRAGKSTLCKDPADGVYYMLLSYTSEDGVVLEINGRTQEPARDAFYRIVACAGEYGRFVTAEPRALLHLRENTDCIIEDNALERLARL